MGAQPQQQRRQESSYNKHQGGKHRHGAKINIEKDSHDAREHMKAHNKEKYVNVDELSQPQLIMQHFRNFDLDKNGKIDGLEILKTAAEMNADHAHDDEDEGEAE